MNAYVAGALHLEAGSHSDELLTHHTPWGRTVIRISISHIE